MQISLDPSTKRKRTQRKTTIHPTQAALTATMVKASTCTEKKESSNKKIKNNNQIAKFKMANGETWEKTFQEKCPDSRVKFMGTYMCPRIHMKGECWSKGCKYKKLHVPTAEMLDDKKQAYIEYMAECRRKSSIK
jgi:hypothetical protein